MWCGDAFGVRRAVIGGREDCRKDNPACGKAHEISTKMFGKIPGNSLPIHAGSGIAEDVADVIASIVTIN